MRAGGLRHAERREGADDVTRAQFDDAIRLLRRELNEAIASGDRDRVEGTEMAIYEFLSVVRLDDANEVRTERGKECR